MLAFFRKYQRYFFLAITIVIVISFSFFGTYSTLANTSGYDQTAFTAIDGTQVTQSELDRMSIFISSDSEDKILFGGMWGPNFLNDGVVKKNFFQTGLAQILASAYSMEIAPDINTRREKEKKYALYVHPQAKFIGVESSWNYLAPEIKTHYDVFKSQLNNSSEDLTNRINLYLAEKKLPANLLKQVLIYQQQQYGWLNPDPNIERTDFSLFGYHSLEDWFGSRFIKLMAEFIINASIMAEQKGYNISKSEVLADLLYNSEMIYKQMLNNPNLNVANSVEFFNEQLRRMQLSQSQAVDLWKKVLLFRRWFNDVGESVFLDPLMFEKFNAYASEKAFGSLYRLPSEFRFGNFNDLQQFEIYLAAISPRDKKSLLALPKQFYTDKEIAIKTPELVQKKYVVDVAQVDITALQGKVGIKETWNWEVEDSNWSVLKNKFADIGSQPALTRDERFAILDNLDDKSRSKIDSFARKSIVENHPEWIDKALSEAIENQMVLKLQLKAKTFPFQGMKDSQDLIRILDNVKLNEQDELLTKYTFDGTMFYRIVVKDRSKDLEVLTFAESHKSGALEDLVNKKLESYYSQVRESHLSDFQKEDKSWKSFQDAKPKLAELYFADILKVLNGVYNQLNGKSSYVLPDIAASLRFYPYMQSFFDIAKKEPEKIPDFLQLSTLSEESKEISHHQSLEDQWKLTMIAYEAERGSDLTDINLEEIFKMNPESWSSIQTPANGDLSLFYLKSKEVVKNLDTLDQSLSIARNQLSEEAQRILMAKVVQELKDKGAISLTHLNHASEAMDVE